MTRLKVMECFLDPYVADWVAEQIPIVKNEPNQEICSLIENLFYDAQGIQAEHEWTPSYLAVFHLERSLFALKIKRLNVCSAGCLSSIRTCWKYKY